MRNLDKLWRFLLGTARWSGRLCLVVLMGLSLTGLSGSQSYWPDIISNFKIPLAIGLAAIAGVQLLLFDWIGVALAVVFVALNLAPILPFYGETRANQSNSAAVKILSLNLWGKHNDDFERTFELIQSRNPDIVCFNEITPQWTKQAKSRLKDYPVRLIDSWSGGNAVFSKLPLKSVRDKAHIQRFNIHAEVSLGSDKLALFACHPPSPFPREKRFQQRNDEFDYLADDLARTKLPSVVIGDLNCTPWSPYFSELITRSGLRDSAVGKGIQPSWTTHLQVPPLLPIDHCLVSQNISVIRREIGPNVGSDHLPVYVELGINSNSPTTTETN
jgi:endonuclease/exonuclease/phosphatase (EEP) superfamily protein YafD